MFSLACRRGGLYDWRRVFAGLFVLVFSRRPTLNQGVSPRVRDPRPVHHTTALCAAALSRDVDVSVAGGQRSASATLVVSYRRSFRVIACGSAVLCVAIPDC